MPNDEALTGPTDSMGPWTIKTIATDTRRTVTRAAQIEGVTVGQWLERHVREWAHGPAPTVAHVASTEAVDDLCKLVDAACRLAEHHDRMPKALRSTVARQLRDTIRATQPQAGAAPPLRIAAKPEPSPADGSRRLTTALATTENCRQANEPAAIRQDEPRANQ